MDAYETISRLFAGCGFKIERHENNGVSVDARDVALPADFDLEGEIKKALPHHALTGGGRVWVASVRPGRASIVPDARR